MALPCAEAKGSLFESRKGFDFTKLFAVGWPRKVACNSGGIQTANRTTDVLQPEKLQRTTYFYHFGMRFVRSPMVGA